LTPTRLDLRQGAARAAMADFGAHRRGKIAMRMIVRFAIGALVGVFGLLALFLASGSRDAIFYQSGLILAVGCIVFIFWLIKRSFDDGERPQRREAID
jgi:lipopolysaccharide export LptBFGC system permease protein LptF